MDEDMAAFPADIEAEGISAGLAANFASPEALAGFISDLLAGPYVFDETIDSVNVNLTVDLSAFFTNPIDDLRDLLPLHEWKAPAEWAQGSYEEYSEETGEWTSFDAYGDNLEIDVDESGVASIDTSEWGTVTVTLNEPYTVMISADSGVSVMPVILTDDQGEELDIQTLFENDEFFPYFNDYTLNGLFPGMTRQKWLDLIYQ